MHKKFLAVQIAIAQGKTFKHATKQFVRFWRGKGYRCDRARKAHFSLGALRTLYLKWQRAGREPSALVLNYRGLAPSVPAPLLIRFIEFTGALQFPHMNTGWREFTRRDGRFGRGSAGEKPVAVTYAQVQYYFTGKKFARLQSAQRAIQRAEKHLANLRLQYIHEIRQRLPDRPRRLRRSGTELSLGSAEL